MNRLEYKKIVDKYEVKENKFLNLFISFLVGGLLGLVGQVLTDVYSCLFNISSVDACIVMIISLVFIASLFTALGFFDKWVSKCRCGLIIPITGFAHSMTSSAIEFKREGFVSGVGANLFKLAGTVILYGIISSFVVNLIRIYLLGGM